MPKRYSPEELIALSDQVSREAREVSAYTGNPALDKYLGPRTGPYMGKRTKADFENAMQVLERHKSDYKKTSQCLVSYLSCTDLSQEERKKVYTELQRRLIIEGQIDEDVVAASDLHLGISRLKNEKVSS